MKLNINCINIQKPFATKQNKLGKKKTWNRINLEQN